MEMGDKTAIALRAQVVAPNEIVKLAKVIDQSPVSHLFIPDLMVGYDSLEISAACLGVSKGLRVGSGVFRPLEHDLQQLVRRLQTLQAVSGNRYLLGVGTGSPGPNPKKKIEDLLARLEEIRSNLRERSVTLPETYIATLKAGIAREVAGKCDGIILNFCPPEFAKTIVDGVKDSFSGKLEVACYLKVFYSKSKEQSTKLAINEFVMYDSLPQYHKMFEKSGLSQQIIAAARTLSEKEPQYPESLRKTSPVNPTQDELSNYIEEFRKSGVSLPTVYPYFSPNESFDFKHETIQNVISATE